MKEWQQLIKSHVVSGDFPQCTKSRCITMCNQCTKEYSVSAENLKNNIKKNGKVICTQCMLFNRAQAKNVWRDLIRPYYQNTSSVKDQNEIITYICPNCKHYG